MSIAGLLTTIKAASTAVARYESTAAFTLFLASGIIEQRLAMNSAEYSKTSTYAPSIRQTIESAVAIADRAINFESFIICNCSSS